MTSALGKTEQLFLQAFLSEGVLNAKRVKEVYRNAVEKGETEEGEVDLQQLVVRVNQAINPLDLSIKKIISEADGRHHFGLLCSAPPSGLKATTQLIPAELEFIKDVVRLLVESEKGRISSTLIMNETRSLSKEAIQATLDSLSEREYLFCDVEGFYSLGCRGQLELDKFIKQRYGDDIGKCFICSASCLQCEICPACDANVHVYCLKKVFASHKAQKRLCPKCKADWPRLVGHPQVVIEGNQASSPPKKRKFRVPVD